MNEEKDLVKKAVEDEETEAITGMPYGRDDMPPGDLVVKWHEQFPTSEMRGFPFPNLYTVYKSYTMKEQEEMSAARSKIETKTGMEISEYDNSRIILEKCILWPKNFMELFDNGDLPGGIPKVLVSYVMMISGFVDLMPEVL